MKKILWFLLLLLPFVAKADYKIDHYTIDMTILENGNIEVVEIFQLSGEYNGFDRTIFYKNNYPNLYGNSLSSTHDASIYHGSGVLLKEIRGITYDSNKTILEMITNGDAFQKKSTAKKGEYGAYTITSLENGEQYLLYNPSFFNKDFYLSYTLENMAIMHNDIAELGLNLFPKIKQDIQNFTLYIHVPNNERYLKLWAHGGNDVKIENLDVKTVKVTANTLQADTLFDFRLIFDKTVIPKSLKKNDSSVFNTILEIENKFEDVDTSDKKYQELQEKVYNAVFEAEQKKNDETFRQAKELVGELRENDELKVSLQVRLLNLEPKIERKEFFLKTAYSSVIFGWLLILLLMIVYHYTKRDKQSVFLDKYYQDLPPYSPSSVSYLLHRKLSTDDLGSCILLLIDSKIITVSKQGEDYVLKKNKRKKECKESDVRLLKFLFGNDEEVTLTKLTKRAEQDCSNFLTDYSNWFNQALLEAEAEDFYEDVTSFKIFGVIYSIIGIIAGVLLLGKDTYISSVCLILVGVLSMLYFILFAKHTLKGRIELSKWRALKEFMLDFSKIKKKDLPKQSLWPKYLIYSISLGCTDKLFKNMQEWKQEEINQELFLFYKQFQNIVTTAINQAYFSLHHTLPKNNKKKSDL